MFFYKTHTKSYKKQKGFTAESNIIRLINQTLTKNFIKKFYKKLEDAESHRREAFKEVVSLSMKINKIFDKEFIKVRNDQRELLCNVITITVILTVIL